MIPPRIDGRVVGTDSITSVILLQQCTGFRSIGLGIPVALSPSLVGRFLSAHGFPSPDRKGGGYPDSAPLRSRLCIFVTWQPGWDKLPSAHLELQAHTGLLPELAAASKDNGASKMRPAFAASLVEPDWFSRRLE